MSPGTVVVTGAAGGTGAAVAQAKDPAALNDLAVRANLPGRVAKPEEIADVFVRLALGAASLVTGQTLYLDGGFMSKTQGEAMGQTFVEQCGALIVRFNSETIRIEPWGDDALRVRARPGGRVVEPPGNRTARG